MRRILKIWLNPRTIAFTLALMSGSMALTPQAQAAGHQLKVLSYNIWGLPRFLATAPWRYWEIAKRLNEYDVIAIQEAWDPETDILFKLRHSHPYTAFGRNVHALLGASGIMILSKYPITKVARLTYTAGCRLEECFQSKGAVAARIELSPGVTVDVINTHLIAHGKNADIRSRQIRQLNAFARKFSGNRPMIIMGDLNSDFLSPEYHQARAGLGLRDSYNELHPEFSDGKGGYTYDMADNYWANPHDGQPHGGLRFDYVLFQSGLEQNNPDGPYTQLEPIRAELRFEEYVAKPQEEKGPAMAPLSDHYGLSVDFLLTQRLK